MAKYEVMLCYSGYGRFEVEAKSSEEAQRKAEKEAENTESCVVKDFERWIDADMISVWQEGKWEEVA